MPLRDHLPGRHRRDRFSWSRPRWLTSVGRWLPPVTFITIHYAYFIVFCLIGSIIFWKSSDPAAPVPYADSLFLVVSAMTLAGLNTVNLSELTTWQQVILFLYIMLGSTIWVSIWTVMARKNVFSKRFEEIARAQREKMSSTFHGSVLSLRSMSFRKASTEPLPGSTVVMRGSKMRERGADELELDENTLANARRRTSMREGPEAKPTLEKLGEAPGEALGSPRSATTDTHIAFTDAPHPRILESSHGVDGASASKEYTSNDGDDITESEDPSEHMSFRYFLKHRASGHHGEFHSLTSEERTQLGGCEYSALQVLAYIVPIYFILWQLLGCLALGAWINNHMPDTARQNGISPWWLGIFNGISAFNNSGMSLLDANMVPFQGAYLVLITMGLMILAGNTAYPIFLRFIIWSMLKMLRATTDEPSFHHFKMTLEFILQYPRRVYTNLFPSRATWWLLFMVISLNCADWVAFEIFNIGNPAIESIPTGPRILDGLFQALAVRSGGFYVVPIAQISIAVQFLYVVMMYISVYPVVITMRHSNVYEERSLGIYQDEASDNDSDNQTRSTEEPLPTAYTSGASRPGLQRRPTLMRRLSQSIPAGQIGRTLTSTFTPWHGVGVPPHAQRSNTMQPTLAQSNLGFVRQQVHGQLAHDIWWLVLAVFIITAIESSHFNEDPVVFSVFNIIFEVVSGYGTVGISVGVPTAAYSFCGAWHTASKIVLCAVMIRGRHRGLPVALDHAVRLPGEHLHREEEEDNRIRRSLSRVRSHSSIQQQ